MYKDTIEIHNRTLSVYLDEYPENLYLNSLKIELSTPHMLNQTGESTLMSCLILSLSVGSYFKFALYRYMYEAGREVANRPIDLLLLIAALIDHSICLLMVVDFTVGLSLDISLSDYLGEAWCNIHWSAAIFGTAYRTFGSLGIAILRLIYIKLPYQVKDVQGRMKHFFCVLISCLLISILLTIGFSIGNGKISRKQVNWNFCIGRSELFREIVDEYSLTIGTTLLQSELMPKLVVLIGLTGIVAEFVCYLVFFHHLYSHDEKMKMKNVLKDSEVRKRHQKNAITFLAQFYGFVVELARVILLAYTMNPDSDIGYRLLMTTSVWVEFGVLSVVEVMTSQGLRSNLPHNIYFK